MKAVVLSRPGVLELVDAPEPATLAPTEVLVATRRVGLCGTDYHAFAGNQNFFTYPRVLGHELAVEVVEVGAQVRNVRLGDRCAVLPYLVCTECFACRRGRTNCCEQLDVLGVTVDGGMRERFVVPAEALYTCPGLDLDALALVETLGIGWHAVWRADAQPDQFALVVGAGPIGLAVGQALRHRRTRVVMTDISEPRLTAAAGSLAVETAAAGDGLAERLRELGDGELPSLVFDATGNRRSMESSLLLVGFSGSLILVGHTTGPLTFENPILHRREVTILASRNARAVDWSQLLPLVESGALDASAWIGRRTTLDGVAEHLGEWGRSAGAVLKAIVDVGG
jgi:2-desacetyl-2-hydroxyethyl bacteriochlorophyllide A dehydrogenase